MKKILFLISILFFGIHSAQTYYSQDFNTPGLNGWVSTDLDGDTYQWSNRNASSVNANFGSGSLVSYSYISTINAGVTPNNLVTSPLINLSTVTAANAYLQYALATYTDDPAEKYSVYVTASNSPATIVASTPVYTETVATGDYQTRAIDLTAYIGQQVYISFRHYDCTNHYYLIIDNIFVKSLPTKDITLKNISLTQYGVISTNYYLTGTLKNNGAETINNATINWNDGTNDHISTITLPTPLLSGGEAVITYPTPVNYSAIITKNITASVTMVNGAADSTPADNSLTTNFTTVSQKSPKKVVIEEGTGTWCGYCPRGAVAMEYMDTNYPNDFIGIAVHNADPMEVTEYNSGANFSGFPKMNVDRKVLGTEVSNNEMVSQVNMRKNLIVPAKLDASTSLVGSTMIINASATFRTNFTNANFRLAVVIVEDEVKGTASGYNQINYYYAGGPLGPMGNYSSLPNPVPAAQMTYGHVGRMLLGGYNGQAGSVPTTLTDGQVAGYTFSTTIPATYDASKLKAVVLLLNATTGEIVNARSFQMNTLGTSDAETNKNYVTVYPNPATDYIKIQADHKVDIKLYDTSGRIVLEKTNISPDSPISVSDLAKGVYMISITEKGSQPKTQKLIIK